MGIGAVISEWLRESSMHDERVTGSRLCQVGHCVRMRGPFERIIQEYNVWWSSKLLTVRCLQLNDD